MRRQSMRRCRDALRKLSEAVAKGRVRAPEKIGARAGRILKEHHGSRYFSWAVTPEGQFRFWVDRRKLREEFRVEGTYLLKTNDPTLGIVEAVTAYKELQTVERAFRDLKDVLGTRPVYHRTEPRVRAHLFVAHLALLLGCALQKDLHRAGLCMGLDTALEALRPIRLIELEVDGQRIQLITRRMSPYAYRKST
jgi:transposase